jgi:hypothetical protein
VRALPLSVAHEGQRCDIARWRVHSARKFIKKKPKVSSRQQRKKEERRKEAQEGGQETGIAGGLEGCSRDSDSDDDEDGDTADRVGKKWKKTKYMRRHRYGMCVLPRLFRSRAT